MPVIPSKEERALLNELSQLKAHQLLVFAYGLAKISIDNGTKREDIIEMIDQTKKKMHELMRFKP